MAKAANSQNSEHADTLKAARDYVWKSFDLHFKQRNEFIRFYTGILVPIYAAYGVVIKEGLFGYGLLVALFAAVVTVLFYSLDQRARSFMWDYEAFMRKDEESMARILGDDTIKLFATSGQRTDNRPAFNLTYTDAYHLFFVLNVAVAAFFSVYCLCHLGT